MPTIYFDSKVKGLLKINGSQCYDICGKVIKIELASCFIIEFCPYENGYLQFCEKMNTMSICATFTHVLFWTQNILSIELCPEKKRQVRPLVAISQILHGENTYTLCDDGSSFLLVESGENMKVLPLNFDFLHGNLSLVSVDEMHCVRLDGRGRNANYLGIYKLGTPFEPLYEGIGESFSLNERTLSRVKNCCSMSHAKVEIRLNLLESESEIEEVILRDYEREYDKNLNTMLKIYAFLECVKDKIESLCMRFLHDELKGDFSINLANSYFSNFSQICMSPLHKAENIVALLYCSGQNTYNARHFCFTFKEGKIVNFSEIV